MTLADSIVGTPVTTPATNIWAVFQDSQGAFWLGSNGNGAYRQKAGQWIQYTTADGLVSDAIRGFQEDAQGLLYIETPKGISTFNGKAFQTLEVDPNPEPEWEATPTDLWFHTNGTAKDVYRYNGESLQELKLPRMDLPGVLGIDTTATRFNPYAVFGIAKDAEGHLWFGTVLAGAFRYNGNSFLWIGERELSRLGDGSEPGVRAMVQDSNGYMWLSNARSRYRISPDTPKGYTRLPWIPTDGNTLEEPNLYFTSGLVDTSGTVWMVSYGKGVHRFDGTAWTHVPLTESTLPIHPLSIYLDRQSTLWVTTEGHGVFRYQGNRFEKFEK